MPTRRDFLKAAGALGAGSIAGGWPAAFTNFPTPGGGGPDGRPNVILFLAGPDGHVFTVGQPDSGGRGGIPDPVRPHFVLPFGHPIDAAIDVSAFRG